MPTIDDFINGAYESRSKPVSAQEAVNVYPEVGASAANPLSLTGVHGTIEAANLGAPIRGLYTAFGSLYCVAGARLYRIFSNGTATDIGFVGDDGRPVSMTHNIFEMLVVSESGGYTVQKNSSETKRVLDTEFPSASVCAFLDGYGLLLEKDSGRFWYTSISDFESINGIDFATAEGAPDELVSLIVDHREIFLFGENTIERWYNSGDSSNPFQRSPGGFIEKGCKGAYSPAKLDNTVFWLGSEGVVYRLNDSTPVRVSNHGIEYLISLTTQDPVGFAYTWNGHSFYQLSFPGELTICFDAATGAWHTRRNYNRKDCVYRHYATAYGKHYVGGDDGKLYEIRDDLYTHNGEVLERIKSAGPLGSGRFQSMSELTFILETGTNSDPLNESETFIEISDDMGRSFSDRIHGSVGAQGAYRQEVKFLALGGAYTNERVVRLTMTDDAAFNLIAAIVP